MIIDFSAHLYPESVLPQPIRDGPLADVLGSMLHDPDELCSLYDAGGIDRAVLSQPYYMGIPDVEAVEKANDALLEVIDEYDRFYGLAAIPVAAGGEAAAKEFERTLDMGYHGGAVDTKTDGIELIDPEFDPIFEVANDRRAPLLVHPKLDNSLHPEVLDDRFLLNAIFGREVALQESLTSVIHHKVLSEYPDLTLVYHHLGGNVACMLGRVKLQLDSGRWPGQTHVKKWEVFADLLQSRIYIDTSGFFGYHQPIAIALEEFTASQILFGTDYPFEPRSGVELTTLRTTIEEVANERDAQAILGGNADRLLANT